MCSFTGLTLQHHFCGSGQSKQAPTKVERATVLGWKRSAGSEPRNSVMILGPGREEKPGGGLGFVFWRGFLARRYGISAAELGF